MVKVKIHDVSFACELDEEQEESFETFYLIIRIDWLIPLLDHRSCYCLPLHLAIGGISISPDGNANVNTIIDEQIDELREIAEILEFDYDPDYLQYLITKAKTTFFGTCDFNEKDGE